MVSQLTQSKLLGLRTKIRVLFAAFGLSVFVSMLAGSALVAFGLDYLLRGPWPFRLGVNVVAMAFLVYCLYRFLIYPLSVKMNVDDMALCVERGFPGLKDRLISSLQLARRFDPEDTFSSSAMVRSLMAETEQVTGNMRFGAVAGLSRRMTMFLVSGLIGLFVLVGGSAAFPDTAQIFWNRVVLLAEADLYPRDWKFQIDNYEKIQYIPSGDKVRIEISVVPAKKGKSKQYEGDKPRIEFSYEGDENRIKEKELIEVADKPGKYYVEIDKVTTNVTFTVKGPSGMAERNFYPLESHINAVQRPAVEMIRHRIYLPKCDKMDERPTAKGGGKIIAYRGSLVDMLIRTNREIKDSSYIQFTNPGKDRKPLGRVYLQRPGANSPFAGDLKYWVATFVVDKPCSYNFVLFDRQFDDERFQNANPLDFDVAVLDDRAPKMQVISPRQTAGPRVQGGVLPIRLKVEDDKYVDNVRLMFRYQAAGGEARRYATYTLYSTDIHRWIRKVRNIKQESNIRFYERECDIDYYWNYNKVADLQLNDTIYFRIIASDGFDLRNAYNDNSVDGGDMSGARAALMSLSVAMVAAETKANDYTDRALLLHWIYQRTADDNALATDYEIAALKSMLQSTYKDETDIPVDAEISRNPTLLDGLELSEEIRLKMQLVMMDSMRERLPEDAFTLVQRVIMRRLMQIRLAEYERDYDVYAEHFSGGSPDNISLVETQKSEAKAKTAVYEQFLVLEDGDIIYSLMKYFADGKGGDAKTRKKFFEQQIGHVRELVEEYIPKDEEERRGEFFARLSALNSDSPSLAEDTKAILEDLAAYKVQASSAAIGAMKNNIALYLIVPETTKEMSEIRMLIQDVEFSFFVAQNLGASDDNTKLKGLYEDVQQARNEMLRCIEDGNPYVVKGVIKDGEKRFETADELKVRHDAYVAERTKHYSTAKNFLAEERFSSELTYSSLVLIYEKLLLKAETLMHLGSVCAKGEAEILKHCKRIDELYYARKQLAEETISANWVALRASSAEVKIYNKQLKDQVADETPIAENYAERMGGLDEKMRSLDQAIEKMKQALPSTGESTVPSATEPAEDAAGAADEPALTLEELEQRLKECEAQKQELKNVRERVAYGQAIMSILADEMYKWIGPHIVDSGEMQIDIQEPGYLKNLLLSRADELNKILFDARARLREKVDMPISNYVRLIEARNLGGREMVDAYKDLYKEDASTIEANFNNKGEDAIVDAINKKANGELATARHNYKIVLDRIRNKILPLAEEIYEDSKYNNLRDENADPDRNLQDILFIENAGRETVDKTVISVLREIDIVYGARIETEIRNIDQRGSDYRKTTEQHISTIRGKLELVSDRLGEALGVLALERDLREIRDRIRRMIALLDPEAAAELTEKQIEAIHLTIIKAGALGLDDTRFIYELLGHPELAELEISDSYKKLDELCDAMKYAIEERKAEKISMETEVNLAFRAKLSWADIIKRIRSLGEDPAPELTEKQIEAIHLIIIRAGGLGLDDPKFIDDLLRHPDLSDLEFPDRFQKLDEVCDAMEYAIKERKAKKALMETEIKQALAAKLSWADIIKRIRSLGEDPAPEKPTEGETPAPGAAPEAPPETIPEPVPAN